MNGPARTETTARSALTAAGAGYGLALLSVAAAFALAQAFLYFHLPLPFTAFALSAIALTFWRAGVGPGIVAILLSLLVRTAFFEPEVGAVPRALYALTFVIFAVLMTWVARGRHQFEARVAERTKELTAANEELKQKIAQLAVASERLQKAQAGLARVNRVTTLGALTAALAHKVNQLIASAVTNAQASLRWLAGQSPNLDEARGAVKRIVGDGTRAAEIVSRIRLLFTKGTTQHEPVDANAVIRDTIDLLQGEATRNGVVLRTGLAAELPAVRGDRMQLRQVVMNLMVNAIDAMDGVDGKRELSIRSQRGQDGKVSISVLDTGVGLPAGKPDQTFEAFFTTKSQGVGMGLAVCRSIVQSHGGRLCPAANSPRGAVFFLTLPADDADGARDAPRGEARASGAQERPQGRNRS